LKLALARIREMAATETRGDGTRLLADRDFCAKLMQAEIGVEAIEMTEHRVLTALASGRNPGPASSMLKTQGTEMMQKLDELAVEATGGYAAVHQPAARQPNANVEPIGPDHSLVAVARYLNNRAATIYGGSNEVQRNIMAQLVLGL
jgi:acyl-CoA dehydrogenase